MNRSLTVLATLTLLAVPLAAHAHFVWAVADPAAKSFLVEFSESPGDSVLPTFAGKGASLRLWPDSGSSRGLSVVGDRLKAALAGGSGAVALDYGVLDRRDAGRGRFLLHYYAKASSTSVASQRKLGLPVEVMLKGSQITVWQNDRPASGAEVVAHLPGVTTPFEGKTDASGTINLPPAGAGAIAIRAMVATERTGKQGDAEYDLIRDYSTLTVQSSGPAKADPAAYAALEKATAARAKMPADLKSVSGRISFIESGQATNGTFVYKPGTGAELKMNGLEDSKARAMTHQISSMLDHRQGSPFSEGDGRNPITFASEDEPAGRRIALNDSLDSYYRVRGDEITEVDREMGAGQRFIISILENLRTPDGKTLPKVFSVSYFDPNGKGLTRAEYFTDAYAKFNGVWLPTSRRILTAQDNQVTSYEIRFEGLKVERGK